RLLLVPHRTSPMADSPVSCEYPHRLWRSFREHVTNKLQIVILFALFSEKGAGHHLRHIGLGPLYSVLISHHAAQTLRQVRMPARPVQHPVEDLLRLCRWQTKPISQRQRFLIRKIGHFNTLADIEWCAPRIADQLAGCGNSEKDKGETSKGRNQGTSIV